MVMKKCLQTYYDIAIGLENFLRSLKSSVVTHKIVTFYIILNHFGSISGLKGCETKKTFRCVFVSKNGVRRRAIMLFVSAGTYGREKVFTNPFTNLLHYCHCSNILLRRTNSSEINPKTLLFA